MGVIDVRRLRSANWELYFEIELDTAGLSLGESFVVRKSKKVEKVGEGADSGRPVV